MQPPLSSSCSFSVLCAIMKRSSAKRIATSLPFCVMSVIAPRAVSMVRVPSNGSVWSPRRIVVSEMPASFWSARKARYRSSVSVDIPYFMGDETSPWWIPISPFSIAALKPWCTRTRIVLLQSIDCRNCRRPSSSSVPSMPMPL